MFRHKAYQIARFDRAIRDAERDPLTSTDTDVHRALDLLAIVGEIQPIHHQTKALEASLIAQAAILDEDENPDDAKAIAAAELAAFEAAQARKKEQIRAKAADIAAQRLASRSGQTTPRGGRSGLSTPRGGRSGHTTPRRTSGVGARPVAEAKETKETIADEELADQFVVTNEEMVVTRALYATPFLSEAWLHRQARGARFLGDVPVPDDDVDDVDDQESQRRRTKGKGTCRGPTTRSGADVGPEMRSVGSAVARWGGVMRWYLPIQVSTLADIYHPDHNLYPVPVVTTQISTVSQYPSNTHTPYYTHPHT